LIIGSQNGKMFNHLELFWLPVFETFPGFSALFYFNPGATKSATKLLNNNNNN